MSRGINWYDVDMKIYLHFSQTLIINHKEKIAFRGSFSHIFLRCYQAPCTVHLLVSCLEEHIC